MTAGTRRHLLPRTFTRARWDEYRDLVRLAKAHGYLLISLEKWLDAGGEAQTPTVIVRHDVDQAPRSALSMLRVEREEAVEGTWYFRWRTATPDAIGAVRRAGAGVGFHYETLTRIALERGLGPDEAHSLVSEARRTLKREIAAFALRFGPIRSVCPHGDTRAPGVRNALLLENEDWHDYGVAYDGNAAMRGHPLGCWLTDRTVVEGRWADGRAPADLFSAGVTPILCVTHPNNWASGGTLWADRIVRGVADVPGLGVASNVAPPDRPPVP